MLKFLVARSSFTRIFRPPNICMHAIRFIYAETKYRHINFHNYYVIFQYFNFYSSLFSMQNRLKDFLGVCSPLSKISNVEIFKLFSVAVILTMVYLEEMLQGE